jgi:hypothetical protein
MRLSSTSIALTPLTENGLPVLKTSKSVRIAANDEVVRLGYGLLQTRYIAGERQHAHDALLLTIARLAF